jgi:hypothetical protein
LRSEEVFEGGGGDGQNVEEWSQRHRVFTRRRWQRGAVGVVTKLWARERWDGRDRRGFLGREGEIGRNDEERANDTALSRGVVGIGMRWVRGRHYGPGRGGVVEIEGGFVGGWLKFKKS